MANHGLVAIKGQGRFRMPRDRAVWQVGATLLLILGAKLALIGMVANPVPYWDQWFAEGEQLFLPYLLHGSGGPNWLAAHNEHRILFTRLLVVAVLELCGGWNTIAEMMAGALVHVAALASMAWCLRRNLLSALLLPTTMLILVFAIPFGGENTLWGLESANYFIILFGIWTVALTTAGMAFEPRWWLGYAFGIAGFFAMASAGTALAAAGIVAGAQIAVRARSRHWREPAGAFLLLATGMALLAITPPSPGSTEMQPTSIAGYLWSFGLAGGWPITLPAIGPFILHLPTLYLAWQLWRRRTPASDHAWRIVALAAWIGLQAAGTAYIRYTGPIASRYIDTLGLACVINACAIVAIGRLRGDGGPSRLPLPAAAWIAGIAACLVFQAVYFFPRAYYFDPRIRAAQVANVTAFMTTGVFGSAGQAPYSLTYNDVPRLAQVLEQPLVRGLLPAELGSSDDERTAARQRLALGGGARLTWQQAARIATVLGIAFLAAGTWLYVFLALGRQDERIAASPRRRREERAGPGYRLSGDER